MSLIRQLIETNTIGVMAMCQAVIPQMRERRSGTIINVTSSVTLGEFPLAAAYTATKQAIEGFSASLAHEPRLFRGPREVGRTRLCANHPVWGECHRSCLGAPSRRLCRIRTANSRGVRKPGPDHHRKRCCRSNLAGPFTIPITSSASLPERTLSRLLRRVDGGWWQGWQGLDAPRLLLPSASPPPNDSEGRLSQRQHP